MQALDTPWNALQVEAITRTLADYGIEVVAVTDAAQMYRQKALPPRAAASSRLPADLVRPSPQATRSGNAVPDEQQHHAFRIVGAERQKAGRMPATRPTRIIQSMSISFS